MLPRCWILCIFSLLCGAASHSVFNADTCSSAFWEVEFFKTPVQEYSEGGFLQDTCSGTFRVVDFHQDSVPEAFQVLSTSRKTERRQHFRPFLTLTSVLSGRQQHLANVSVIQIGLGCWGRGRKGGARPPARRGLSPEPPEPPAAGARRSRRSRQ